MMFEGVVFELFEKITTDAKGGSFQVIKKSGEKIIFVVGPKMSGKSTWIRDRIIEDAKYLQSSIHLDRPSDIQIERTLIEKTYDIIYIEMEEE